MLALEIARHYRDVLQDERIDINIREDKSIQPGELFLAGWCDGADLDFPIEISFVVNNEQDDLIFDSELVEAIHREFCYTLNHELVHLEQFIDNSEYDEEEAYGREHSFDLLDDKIVLSPFINRS
jgi:hypothetical protein